MSQESKTELRKRLRAARRALSAEEHAERSARATAALLRARPASAQTILAFVSLGAEIATSPLLQALWDLGLSVAVPRVTGDGRMEAVSIGSAEDLVPGFKGIPEPAGGVVLAPEAIDLVVVPGTAFDAAGRRLGQGGGFYDRYLPRTRSDCLRVGFCFDLQIVDEVPSESHDERVDLVVTESRTLHR